MVNGFVLHNKSKMAMKDFLWLSKIVHDKHYFIHNTCIHVTLAPSLGFKRYPWVLLGV